MKRSLASVAVLLALAILNGNAVAGREARVEHAEYVSDGLFVAGHGNLGGQHEPHLIVPEDPEPIVFEVDSRERHVRITVEDRSTPWPLVFVQQDVEGRDHPEEFQFCASTRRLALTSAAPLRVWVFNGFCSNHTWGAATTGTITATFTR